MDLDRRLIDLEALSADDDVESVVLQSLVSSRLGLEDELLTWDQALGRARHLVVLGEAGAGKTWELRALVDRLSRAGSAAAFIRLEDLHDEVAGVAEGIGASSGGDVTLALDSVDEARLKGQQPLARCLPVLERRLGALWPRTRLVISCRVSDWMVRGDGRTLDRLLPPGGPVAAPRPEVPGVVRLPSKEDHHRVRVMCLAPLSQEQVMQLARAEGVKDAERFAQELARSGANELCGRPQDVVAQVAHWNERGRLGNLGQVLEADVARKLRQTDDRREAEPLPEEDARVGAEVLAAALVLGRTQWIGVPDEHLSPVGADAIDAMAALPGWSRAKVKVLLGRAIFDEATLGCVRFHHRTAKEFLAARWVAKLERRCGRRRIERILAGEPFGEAVLHPATTSLLAWLASWDPGYAELALQRAPFLLLHEGNPQALDVSVKNRLLRAIVAEGVRQPSWWHLGDTWAMTVRFAEADLAPTVETLLSTVSSEDGRLHLLRIALAGKMSGCAERCLGLATSDDVDLSVRRLAIDVVAEAGSDGQVQALVDYLARPNVEGRIALRLWEDLFPDRLGVAALIDSLTRHCGDREEGPDVDSLFHTHVAPRTPIQELPRLLSALLGLVRGDAGPARMWLLGPACSILHRMLAESPPGAMPEEPAASALALVHRLLRNDPDARALVRRPSIRRELADVTARHPQVRRALFWLEVGDSQRVRSYDHSREPEPSDLAWLLDEFGSGERRARVALHAALLATRADPVARERVRQAVTARPALREELARLEAPPVPHEPCPAERREAQRQTALANRRAREREQWQARTKLLREGDEALLSELAASFATSRSEVNWQRMEGEHGPEVVEAAREGMMLLWRRVDPPALPDSSMSRPDLVVPCLVGLDLFFERRTAAFHPPLSEEVGARAARHALWAHGPTHWLTAVADQHTAVVRDIFLRVVEHDFQAPDDHWTLSKIAQGPESLRKACAPRITELLASAEPRSPRSLERALEIVLEEDAGRRRIAAVAEARTRTAVAQLPTPPSPGDGSDAWRRCELWVWAWLAVDAAAAIRFLQAWIKRRRSPAATDVVSALLTNSRSTIFGLGGRRSVRAESGLLTSLLEPTHLADFLELVLLHLRPGQGDRVQGGPRALRQREARETQDWLVNMLGSQDSETAYRALKGLGRRARITDPATLEWFDRMAVGVAARSSQGPRWTQAQVAELTAQAQARPRTAGELFELALSRLDDIVADLERGDFSARDMFRPDDPEVVVQKWLARELRVASASLYSVIREEEVDLRKKPDIRLRASPEVEDPVCIEAKLADKNTCSELESALRDQLVGRYLQDRRSSYGILFLADRGGRWSLGRKQLTLAEVVAHLNELARAIVTSTPSVKDLRVVGVSLLEPVSGRRVKGGAATAQRSSATPSKLSRGKKDRRSTRAAKSGDSTSVPARARRKRGGSRSR